MTSRSSESAVITDVRGEYAFDSLDLEAIFLLSLLASDIFLLGIWDEEVGSMALTGKRSLREKAFSRHRFSSWCGETFRFSICLLTSEITEPEHSDSKSEAAGVPRPAVRLAPTPPASASHSAPSRALLSLAVGNASPLTSGFDRLR